MSVLWGNWRCSQSVDITKSLTCRSAGGCQSRLRCISHLHQCFVVIVNTAPLNAQVGVRAHSHKLLSPQLKAVWSPALSRHLPFLAAVSDFGGVYGHSYMCELSTRYARIRRYCYQH